MNDAEKALAGGSSGGTATARLRPQSAGAVTVSQRIAHRNFRTPEMIIQDSKKKHHQQQEAKSKSGSGISSDAPSAACSGKDGVDEGSKKSDSGNAVAQPSSAAALQISNSSNGRVYHYHHKQANEASTQALSNLSSKFCSASELQYLQSVMSSGNLKGRSTTEFYTIGKVVGVGSFAKVRLAWHKLTGQAIAIKTYEKSKMKDASHLRRVQQEIKVMEKLNHPRLIRLFETLESPKRIHLIMEFVSAGNLCSYVKRRKRLPEEDARKIFHQICVALDYMHGIEIIHRDVKLENVLLDKVGNSKLIDFGFSAFSKDKKALKVFCGTPSYMAPEIVRRIEYDGKPVDAWSLGIVLYAMVCGCFPFSAKNYPDLYKKIMRGQFRIPENLSEGLKDLIRNLLVVDAKKRYSVAQAKSHPWVHGGKLGNMNDSLKGWQCDPGCSEILISKNPANDLNEGVMKMMDEFGIRREMIVHNVVNKAHNGISTCYYLLKQAMKDNGTLDESAKKGDGGNGTKVVISSAAYSGSKTGKIIRPLSAPFKGSSKNGAPSNRYSVREHTKAKDVKVGTQAQQTTNQRQSQGQEDELEEDDGLDSFIKEDNDDGSTS